MADEQYKRLTCGRCLVDFTSPRKKKYCSPRCREGSTMTRAEYFAKCREGAAGNFVCECCGEPSYRELGGRNKRLGYENRFCSMACRVKAGEARQAEAALMRQARRALVAVIRRIAKERKPRHSSYRVYVAPRVRTCPCCGLAWSAFTWYGPSQYCQSPECQEALAQVRRLSKRNDGNTHRSRARKLGRQFKGFNVIRVFERDKWTCQLCGVRTPRKLRGTLQPNAPELDHIVALGIGGDHVIENTQCACRQCNIKKGATARGQMWLGGFADTSAPRRTPKGG